MTKTGAQAKTTSSRIAGKENRRKQRVKNELLQEEIDQETTRAQAGKRPDARKRGGRTWRASAKHQKIQKDVRRRPVRPV